MCPAAIAQIARLALMQIQTRLNAFYARRVLGVVESELTISRPAKIVLLGNTRPQRVLQKSQGVIYAVLAGFRAKRERLCKGEIARIATKANTEQETISIPRRATIVLKASTRTRRVKRRACRACPASSATRRGCWNATSVL